MARKINPFLFRVVINRNWISSWYTKKRNYANYLLEDLSIRRYLEKFFKDRPIGKIMIFKNLEFIYITIYLKNLSLINKSDLFKLKNDISFFSEKNIFINFKNIVKPDLDPKLIFFYIKKKIELNISYRGVIKNVVSAAFKSKCLGIKIIIHGKIGGSIMTKKQTFFFGKVPLQRICANIRYHGGVANTIHGSIGIKVWLYLGDFMY